LRNEAKKTPFFVVSSPVFSPVFVGLFLFILSIYFWEGGEEKNEGEEEEMGEHKSRAEKKEAAELRSFSEYLNWVSTQGIELFTGDTEKVSPETLTQEISKGVLFARLINFGWPGTIKEKSLTVKGAKEEYAVFDCVLNHDLALDACRDTLAIHVVNIGGKDLADGNENLILGLLWQIIEKLLMKEVEESALAVGLGGGSMGSDGEGAAKKMSPEEVIMKWINVILELSRPQTDLQISNLNSDFEDCEVFARVLHALAPQKFTREDLLEFLEISKPIRRAQRVVDAAYSVLGASTHIFVTAEDIVGGNAKLLFAFATVLFSKREMLPDDYMTKSLANLLDVPAGGVQLGDLKKGTNGTVAEGIWIIEGNATHYEAGTLQWENKSSGKLKITLEGGDSFSLARSDLQVVRCSIWALGLAVTRGGPYKLKKSGVTFTAPAIYFAGIDEEEKSEEFSDLLAWLDRCKIFSLKPKEDEVQ
jgi:Calponin homology (CH) domain